MTKVLSINYWLLPEVGVGLTGSGSRNGVAVPVGLGDGKGLGLTRGVGLSRGEKLIAATFAVGRDDTSSQAKIINAINIANTVRVMLSPPVLMAARNVALTYNNLFASHPY